MKAGLLSVLFVICPILQAEQNPSDIIERFDTQQIADWSVAATDIPMSDGSLLREYLASSDEAEHFADSARKSSSRIDFVFHPRFLCSPLIRVVRSYDGLESGDSIGSSDSGAEVISLDIDGQTVEFPALIERRPQSTRYFYNVNLQRRATLRILVELGDEMSIVYQDGSTVTLSLKGSQKSLEIAASNCSKH